MTENNNQAYYDDFASWYENKRHKGYHAMIDRLELSIITPLAAQNDVLEVGCGTGLLMKEIQKYASSVKGIDISEKMLEHAKARGLAVQQGVAESLPYEDESFDLVYSFKVLAHVQDIKKALFEMNRVLKPGGHMVAEFYNALSVRYLAKIAGGPGKISNTRKENEVFTRWDTPLQVKSYLPPGASFKEFKGVRVLTPFAKVHDVPVVSNVLEKVETWAMDSVFSRFGGFLVAICQKNS